MIVIGAGFTGLQAAIQLKRERGQLEVLVVDRAAIPRGASTRNAGFACFGAPTELLADIEAYGEETVSHTVQQRFRGIQQLADRYGRRSIDWYQHGGYEIIDESTTQNRVRDALADLNRLLAPITGHGITWREIDAKGWPEGTMVLHNPMEGQLHPGKLVQVLLKEAHDLGVGFLMGTEVRQVKENDAGVEITIAGYGSIEARATLVTVNAFARELLPEKLASLICPVRNQVLLSQPGKLPIAPGCYHYQEGYVYFRNVGLDRLLIGGARHVAQTSAEGTTFGNNPVPVEFLLTKLRQWFPYRQWELEDFPYRWSGIIAQGEGKAPLLEFARPRVLVAGRLAGMGVALSGELARRAAGELMTLLHPRPRPVSTTKPPKEAK